ncbi:MAG: hypothetical protein JRJ09_14420 [Deltaproteobacteria bacterium]|nr:hypothetical protein [Deltaproteobacteria bacterium]MBW2049705.1 hypothetical protein [Deltaproteobacteria bacterium]MBW2112759.1 hypothetical protein [Deltaproteobacteria bacterium]MBW2354882.1 hypothetical protein [Deltaproteobacteria bacterium]
MNSTEPGEVRKFGIIAFAFFGLLCGLGIWTKRPVPIFLFGSFSLLGLGFILFPSTLRPVYGAWLKLAHLIGTMVTALALGLAYYLVITPSAWAKRVIGGRPLPLRPDKGATTYWVKRDEPAQPRERFLKRY